MKLGRFKRAAIGVTVAAAAAIAMPSALAFGNNHTDQPYNSYAAGHGVSYTDAYRKTDDSSSWDQCTSAPNHSVEVAITSRLYWNVQFIGSPVYGWWGGKSGYLTNYVWETSHEASALLWFNNTNDYDAYILGYFSPDSI